MNSPHGVPCPALARIESTVSNFFGPASSAWPAAACSPAVACASPAGAACSLAAASRGGSLACVPVVVGVDDSAFARFVYVDRNHSPPSTSASTSAGFQRLEMKPFQAFDSSNCRDTAFRKMIANGSVKPAASQIAGSLNSKSAPTPSMPRCAASAGHVRRRRCWSATSGDVSPSTIFSSSHICSSDHIAPVARPIPAP